MANTYFTLLFNTLWQCPDIVIARSIFVVRTQRISCDIRNFVCRGEKWQFFQLFLSYSYIKYYYSTHCDNVQIWSYRAQCSSCVLKRYPAIYIILCVQLFFFFNKRRKLCFVINVLNSKTIILLNLARVSRGDWLGNAANFKEICLCYGFDLVTWVWRCTPIQLRSKASSE